MIKKISVKLNVNCFSMEMNYNQAKNNENGKREVMECGSWP